MISRMLASWASRRQSGSNDDVDDRPATKPQKPNWGGRREEKTPVLTIAVRAAVDPFLLKYPLKNVKPRDPPFWKPLPISISKNPKRQVVTDLSDVPGG